VSSSLKIGFFINSPTTVYGKKWCHADGERTASSTNVVGKSGYPSAKN
jgi:hypothetical protein